MNPPVSRVLDYLQHMLEAITRIHRYEWNDRRRLFGK